jgi:TDG/mug DNA glycosylase family protein
VADGDARVTDVLPDYLAKGLRAVFCGTAVATASRDRGGYYAGSGNDFWLYLRQSGLIRIPLGPDSDRRILEFKLGLTDLVKGSAKSSDRGLIGYDVPGFIHRMEKYEPSWVAFHGKEAAKQVSRHLGEGSDVSLGTQMWRVAGRPAYVLPSASGSNRGTSGLEGKANRLEWFEAFADLLPR